MTESEFRSYPLIQQSLSDMGWNVRSPDKGGQVYTQNEATSQNTKLKQALGSGRPEYVVVVNEADFWVIEAKASEKQLAAMLIKLPAGMAQANAGRQQAHANWHWLYQPPSIRTASQRLASQPRHTFVAQCAELLAAA